MALQVQFSDVVLTPAAAPVVTSTSAQSSTIMKATAVNTDTTAHTVTVYRVPNGDSPGVAFELIQAMSIAAGATVVLPLGGQVLTNGANLQALSEANAVVNLNVSFAITT